MITIHPHFIIDAKGQKTSVILSVKEYEAIMEELEDLEDIKLYDETKKEDTGERILLSDYLKPEKTKMANYTVVLLKKAQRQLDNLSFNIAEPILFNS